MPDFTSFDLSCRVALVTGASRGIGQSIAEGLARMKAVRLHGVGDLRVETIDAPPSPAGDQILLRVAAAGLCGSEMPFLPPTRVSGLARTRG